MSLRLLLGTAALPLCHRQLSVSQLEWLRDGGYDVKCLLTKVQIALGAFGSIVPPTCSRVLRIRITNNNS
jgi:hypothetical protein